MKQSRRYTIGVLVCAALIVSCGSQCDDGSAEHTALTEPSAEPPAEAAPSGESRLRTVYIPAYSHLPQHHTKPTRRLLSILLSVRNVDSAASVTLTHVDYFDTSGHRVRRYLEAPRSLRPLETAEFMVETDDDVGGSGANFLVYWEGPSDAHPLLTEAVMWGNLGQGYVSFTSRGVELDRRPGPGCFIVDDPPARTPPASQDAAPAAQ